MWCNVPSPFRILHVAVGSDRDVWAIIDDEKENPLGATSLVDTKSNVVSWDGKGWVRMPGRELAFHLMVWCLVLSVCVAVLCLVPSHQDPSG